MYTMSIHVKVITAPDEISNPSVAELFYEVVLGGASMGFVADLTQAQSLEFWNSKLAALGQDLVMFAAFDGELLVGFALLCRATMPNGLHRAEVQKVLTRPGYQRRGVASMLLSTLEEYAKTLELRLLFLDTEEDSVGESFYRAKGWIECGRMPEFAVDMKGVLFTTIFFYKLI